MKAPGKVRLARPPAPSSPREARKGASGVVVPSRLRLAWHCCSSPALGSPARCWGRVSTGAGSVPSRAFSTCSCSKWDGGQGCCWEGLSRNYYEAGAPGSTVSSFQGAEKGKPTKMGPRPSGAEGTHGSESRTLTKQSSGKRLLQQKSSQRSPNHHVTCGMRKA